MNSALGVKRNPCTGCLAPQHECGQCAYGTKSEQAATKAKGAA